MEGSPSSNQPYSSVDWLEVMGREEEFIECWRELAEWMIDHPLGVGSMVLLRDWDDPRRFRSVLSWSRIAFARASCLFGKGEELYDRCLALCESLESRYFLSAARLYG